MSFSDVYVDPSIASDSGTGTIGDPFGDLEYAIEQTTFNTSGGTRVNVRATSDEILVASLENALANAVTTPAWVPSETNPCIFQGYSSVAGDLEGTGTTAGISGGGLVSIMGGDARNGVHFVDLHIHNTGANEILSINDDCSAIRCEIDNSTAGGIDADNNFLLDGCYVHNIAGIGVFAANLTVIHSWLANGTNKFTNAIEASGNLDARRNIIILDSTSSGIDLPEDGVAEFNSIYSNGGTGSGITTALSALIIGVSNNLVEGFSGTGGIGIDLAANAFVGCRIFRGNGVYNCATAYNSPTTFSLAESDNETLTASPFTNASAGDFSPVDTGSVRNGSLPQNIADALSGNTNPLRLHKGAVQPLAAAGGGSFVKSLVRDLVA